MGGYYLRARKESKGEVLLEREKLKLLAANKANASLDTSAEKPPKLLGRLLGR